MWWLVMAMLAVVFTASALGILYQMTLIWIIVLLLVLLIVVMKS